MNQIAIFCLVSAAIGGVAWVFIYPILSGERQADQRRAGIVQTDPLARRANARTVQTQKVRREQIEETLKGLEERSQRAKSPPLNVRIEQAGLTWSKQRFWITSGIIGLAFTLVVLITGAGFLPALATGFAATLGLPRWILKYLKGRRERKFLDHFPDSVDTIVRGIKAGLPLLDSMKVIVADAPEPIRGEFKAMLETQSVGIPISEACGKLYERLPLAEANFFGIVISIQQKAGGNLSEALSNLSRVLRDRKKMKAKIKAMSMEAKASAGIIGSLPPLVMFIVYIVSPDYISLLWEHPIGRVMMAGCALWMSIGIFSMKKMINFDF